VVRALVAHAGKGSVKGVASGQGRVDAGAVGPTLLCEDDDDIRFLVTLLLESAGHTVVPTADVAEALAALEQGDFELVLTDLGLPDGDGSTVGESARSSGARVIVLTARLGAVDDATVQSWADRILAKPFSPDDLISALS
jgi:DNA-binding response OmpR family regulator